jgi:lysophospholipase L1-like esterase
MFFNFAIRHVSIFAALLCTPLFAGNEKNYSYLALGDSVAFGLDIRLIPTAPGQPAPSPDQFIGYPEVLADLLHLQQSKKEVNAACPGDTSGSFYIPGAPDHMCRAFRAAFGLHTNYSGTQGSFAVSQLAENKHIDLVTLGIGGDDLQLLQESCMTNPFPYPSFEICVQNLLPGVLQAYGNNLFNILSLLRGVYGGTLVLVEYYPVNADPLFSQAIVGLNQVMIQVGSLFNVKFADSFAAFEAAIASIPGANGDPCKAGLLIRLSPTTCDVHPSPAGRAILALTVQAAIGSNH